jgi:hypothetical protein
MTSDTIRREILPGGAVVLHDERCRFTFKAAPGVLEIAIEGVDRGQFGSAPLDEIARALVRDRPLELFIDASAASMPVVEVSREWTRFFALNRQDLERVSVLVGSKAVELTVAIAQHLSRTGKLIQIYSDRQVFEARKASR